MINFLKETVIHLKETKPRHIPVWIIQAFIQLIISLLCSLSLAAGGIIHNLCLYCFLPLISAYTAARCVLRGLNNYLALVAPIILFPLSYILIWGYMPQPAPVLLCEFITVIGSAAGEVLRSRNKQK